MPIVTGRAAKVVSFTIAMIITGNPASTNPEQFSATKRLSRVTFDIAPTTTKKIGTTKLLEEPSLGRQQLIILPLSRSI